MDDLIVSSQNEARSVHEAHVPSPMDQSLLADSNTHKSPAGDDSALRRQLPGFKDVFRLDRAHPESPGAAMLLCIVVGILLAVSHHLFYHHLNGTTVKSKNNQEWALRFGNAFALATKAALVAAVGLAYTQRIWTAFREKVFTVEGIDAAVAAPNDVFAFFNKDIWMKSFTGTMIAGLLW